MIEGSVNKFPLGKNFYTSKLTFNFFRNCFVIVIKLDVQKMGKSVKKIIIDTYVILLPGRIL